MNRDKTLFVVCAAFFSITLAFLVMSIDHTASSPRAKNSLRSTESAAGSAPRESASQDKSSGSQAGATPLSTKPILPSGSQSEPTNSRAPYKRRPANDMYADLQEVFAAYPALKQSYDTESKVIFGDDDWTKLASTLSDQQLIDDVLGQMTAQYASMTEDTESMINLVRVDFLKQAIKLQNNPARDHLLQRLALELERFPERDPDTHHADALSSIGYKHMIGDKIELIYVLKTYEHDFYAMLKEDSSEKLQSLIAYANEHEPALRKIAD